MPIILDTRHLSQIERERERNRGEVSIALMDENVGLLNTLRGSLRGNGYRRIDVHRSAAALEIPLNGRGFDLIIGDANLDGGAMLKLVRRIRAGNLARNPFTALIVTSWISDWNIIRQAIDAGVDDILINPISPGKLLERIQQIVHHRKPFIVTADYTGPERRRDPYRRSTIPAFNPPNTLAEREISGAVNISDQKRRIDDAARQISREKLRRLIFQMAFLVGLGELAVTRNGPPAVVLELLDRLRTLTLQAATLVDKIGPPVLIEPLREIHDCLNGLANRGATTPDLDILHRFANDLLAQVFPEKNVTETHSEVKAAIRGYEQRRQRQFARVG